MGNVKNGEYRGRYLDFPDSCPTSSTQLWNYFINRSIELGMARLILGFLFLSFFPIALSAKPEVSVDQVKCLPASEHGVITAQVKGDPPAATTRIFFRRLNKDIDDFYYVVAYTNGGGDYWGTLPKPKECKLLTPALSRNVADWWKEREGELRYLDHQRTWLLKLDFDTLKKQFEEFRHEPVEYYGALFDASGNQLARSDIKVVPVRDDCELKLTPQQKGESENLIVGETTTLQGKDENKLFHWECSGIVTRIDPNGVRRADVCRDPFIALWEEEQWPEEENIPSRGNRGEAKRPYQSVEVFYGTDRKWSMPGGDLWKYDTDSESVVYGVERGNLEFGTLRVSIPVTHVPGELEGMGLFEYRMDPKRHVTLLMVDRKPRELFLSELQDRIACGPSIEDDESPDCKPGKKAALVFIHGYNVSFEDAARRTAQVAYDLTFDGVPLMYSWPSQASVAGYTVDETNIRWTVPHLEEFLTLVTKDTQADSVHIIAHSMGNRALTEVLRRFSTEQAVLGHPRFNQIVLVAPDVDAAVFRDEIAPAFAGVGERVTLYASAHDKALNVSKGLHQYLRAGDLSEEVLIAEGVDTIDASDVDTSLLRALSLGHSYFARKASAIADLKATLAGVKPNDRTPKCLGRFYSESGDTYWKIRGGKTPCR